MKSFRSRGNIGSGNSLNTLELGENYQNRKNSSSPASPVNPVNPKPPGPGERLRQRVMVACFISICLLVIFDFFAWDPPSLPEHARPPSRTTSTSHLTVMINTFKRPPEVVEDAIDHYSQCKSVRYVYVIWSDKANPPPTDMMKRYGSARPPSTISGPTSVGFLVQDSTSLNNRFRPLLDVEHTDAIFAVDDDMRVACKDLEVAFEAWRASPESLVGFMPRVHIRDSQGILRYRCWWSTWWHGVYSMVLTKAAILHHKFLVKYTSDMPAKIRDLIDHERNCEDIAMQFLMSNATRLPPIYVKGHVHDLGVFGGISTSHNVAKAKHMDSRSNCLNRLVEFYDGANPLVTSHYIVDSAANGWTNAPSTWFEFISSDLWAGIM